MELGVGDGCPGFVDCIWWNIRGSETESGDRDLKCYGLTAQRCCSFAGLSAYIGMIGGSCIIKLHFGMGLGLGEEWWVGMMRE